MMPFARRRGAAVALNPSIGSTEGNGVNAWVRSPSVRWTGPFGVVPPPWGNGWFPSCKDIGFLVLFRY